MKKKFYVGQKGIWHSVDFEGESFVKAIITEVYEDHAIARTQGNLTIQMLNVGQGDSILVKTAEQTVLKRYYVGGGTVAAEHHRMVVEVQVVEDVEEGILRLGLSGQLLDVVDNEHVDALVEAEELVDVSARRLGRGVLTLEVEGWDIQHALAGIALGKLQSHAL